jgi:hypothetical protein
MISFENIEEHSVPLSEHPRKWLFYDEDTAPSEEHKDQIIALDPAAAKFLWDFERDIRITSFYPDVNRYFRETTKFSFGENMESQVKNWLYNRGIPFSQKVFYSIQPDSAFILTWKMVVHYSADLFFGHDLVVWDPSLNWGLYYDHNDLFTFGRNRIYDGQEEQLKYNALIREINEQIELRKKSK